ncbi:unnamed protein product, partial [Phaeothamnion confervicola]
GESKEEKERGEEGENISSMPPRHSPAKWPRIGVSPQGSAARIRAPPKDRSSGASGGVLGLATTEQFGLTFTLAAAASEFCPNDSPCPSFTSWESTTLQSPRHLIIGGRSYHVVGGDVEALQDLHALAVGKAFRVIRLATRLLSGPPKSAPRNARLHLEIDVGLAIRLPGGSGGKAAPTWELCQRFLALAPRLAAYRGPCSGAAACPEAPGHLVAAAAPRSPIVAGAAAATAAGAAVCAAAGATAAGAAATATEVDGAGFAAAAAAAGVVPATPPSIGKSKKRKAAAPMSRWHSSTKKGKKCKGGDEDEDANTSKAAKAAEAAARAKAAKAALDAIYASLEPSEDKAAPVGGFVPQACPLLVLGEHIVAQVLRFLSAASLEASVRTCRELRCIGAPIVPGLRLTLFPHQRSSLCWMRERELERAAAPSDLLLPLRATSGRRVWLQRGDCCWRMEEPPLLPPVRGGMLCDEPGLGKTITVLSLLLRTRGCLPLSTAVPEISEAERWSRAEEKWRHWGNLEKARELARIVRDLWVCEGERGAAGIYNRPVKKPPKPLTSPPAAVRRPEVMVAAIASAAAATVAAAATAAAAAAAPFDPEREGEGSPAVWGAAAVAAAAPSPVPNAAAEPVVLRLPVSPGGAATAGSEVGGDRGDAINGCGMSNGGSGGCFGDETAAGADQLGNGHGDGNGAAASGAFPAGKKAPGRAGMSKCVVRQVREAAAGPEADLAAVDLAIQKDAYPTLREFRTDVETVLRRAKQEAAARGQRAKDEAAAAAAAEVALAAAAVVAGP